MRLLPGAPHKLECNFRPASPEKRCTNWRSVCEALALPRHLEDEVAADR